MHSRNMASDPNGFLLAVGEIYGAICNACETKFEASEGSGMYSMPFHCNTCGKVWDWEFGDPSDAGGFIEDGDDGSAPEEGRREAVGSEADTLPSLGKPDPPPCDCGGTFDVTAPPRCPKCRAADFRRDPAGQVILWD